MLTVNHGERVDERLAGGEMRLVDGVARRRQRQANGDGVRLLVDGGGSPARLSGRQGDGGGSPAACACSVRLLVCVMPLLNACTCVCVLSSLGPRLLYIGRGGGPLTLRQETTDLV